MEMLAPFIAYAVALGISALIPGPGIAALVGHSLGNGFRPALYFMAGIALGDVVYLTVAVLGLAALVHLFAGAFVVIKVVGGVYLIYLAYGFWTSEGGLADAPSSRAKSPINAFVAGFLVTLSNPKAIVFYLALLPTVLNLASVTFGQWVVLAMLTVAVLFSAMIPYSLLSSRARHMMTRPEALRRLNKTAGAVIGAAGAFIFGQALVGVLRRA